MNHAKPGMPSAPAPAWCVAKARPAAAPERTRYFAFGSRAYFAAGQAARAKKNTIGTHGRSCTEKCTWRSPVATSHAATHAPTRIPAARAPRNTTTGVSAPKSATSTRAGRCTRKGSAETTWANSPAPAHSPVARPSAY